MNKRISEDQAAEYEGLERAARAITEAVSNFVVAVAEADVPEEVKVKCLEIADGLDTFGLAYRLHPQSEWTGGDSSDPKNTVINAPHIANER